MFPPSGNRMILPLLLPVSCGALLASCGEPESPPEAALVARETPPVVPEVGNGTSGIRVQEPDSAALERLRRQMVDRQIEARGVRDTAVLRAMRTVPRHRFVPEASPTLAYGDHPLPISHGQTISQPYIVAFMVEAAHLSPGDRVLEIGSGSGYGAAVLAEVAAEVFTVEIVPQLADRARTILRELRYRNVMVRTGNGWAGWEEHAPYDAIVVTAAPEEIPAALVDQLAMGGTLVIPVGDFFQTLRVLRKTPGGLVEEASLPVRFVPMIRALPDTGRGRTAYSGAGCP